MENHHLSFTTYAGNTEQKWYKTWCVQSSKGADDSTFLFKKLRLEFLAGTEDKITHFCIISDKKKGQTREGETETEEKWGHLGGQNNLEPITQRTQWDPSTPAHSPSHSSHDVTRKRASALSYITAHKAGETAKDKPDECFLALKVEDATANRVLGADRRSQTGQQATVFTSFLEGLLK